MIEVTSPAGMEALAERLGDRLKGGEVIELIGDVGAGKTTFVRGLAKGLAVVEDIQSPSFTISRQYDARNKLRLLHYDFYRLKEPGIMSEELTEAVNDPRNVVVIEWAASVSEVLPKDRLVLSIKVSGDTGRSVDVLARDKKSNQLAEMFV